MAGALVAAFGAAVVAAFGAAVAGAVVACAAAVAVTTGDGDPVAGLGDAVAAGCGLAAVVAVAAGEASGETAGAGEVPPGTVVVAAAGADVPTGGDGCWKVPTGVPHAIASSVAIAAPASERTTHVSVPAGEQLNARTTVTMSDDVAGRCREQGDHA